MNEKRPLDILTQVVEEVKKRAIEKVQLSREEMHQLFDWNAYPDVSKHETAELIMVRNIMDEIHNKTATGAPPLRNLLNYVDMMATSIDFIREIIGDTPISPIVIEKPKKQVDDVSVIRGGALVSAGKSVEILTRNSAEKIYSTEKISKLREYKSKMGALALVAIGHEAWEAIENGQSPVDKIVTMAFITSTSMPFIKTPLVNIFAKSSLGEAAAEKYHQLQNHLDGIKSGSVELKPGLIRVGGKTIPVLGAVINEAFVLVAVGQDLYQGKPMKATGNFIAGTAGSLGDLIGCGLYSIPISEAFAEATAQTWNGFFPAHKVRGSVLVGVAEELIEFLPDYPRTTNSDRVFLADGSVWVNHAARKDAYSNLEPEKHEDVKPVLKKLLNITEQEQAYLDSIRPTLQKHFDPPTEYGMNVIIGRLRAEFEKTSGTDKITHPDTITVMNMWGLNTRGWTKE